MRNQSNTTFAIRSSLAMALALTIGAPLPAQTPAPGTMGGTMMEMCQEMRAKKQKLQEDITAMDAQLTRQIAAMNSAPADKKIGLIAAVVTTMAEQRIAMDARRSQLEQEMMRHMMQHMQMGKESISQCPMMTGMKGMPGMQGKKGMKGMKGMSQTPDTGQKEK
jgi:hypothetical protein